MTESSSTDFPLIWQYISVPLLLRGLKSAQIILLVHQVCRDSAICLDLGSDKATRMIWEKKGWSASLQSLAKPWSISSWKPLLGLKEVVGSKQHGFTEGKSHLIASCDKITDLWMRGE